MKENFEISALDVKSLEEHGFHFSEEEKSSLLNTVYFKKTVYFKLNGEEEYDKVEISIFYEVPVVGSYALFRYISKSGSWLSFLEFMKKFENGSLSKVFDVEDQILEKFSNEKTKAFYEISKKMKEAIEVKDKKKMFGSKSLNIYQI